MEYVSLNSKVHVINNNIVTGETNKFQKNEVDMFDFKPDDNDLNQGLMVERQPNGVKEIYDKNGNLIKRINKSSDATWIEEFDKNGNVIKDTTYDSEDNLIVVYEMTYDDKNNRVKEIAKNPDGSVYAITTYSYNGADKLESYITTNAEGTSLNKHSFEYTSNGYTERIDYYEKPKKGYYQILEYDNSGNKVRERSYSPQNELI